MKHAAQNTLLRTDETIKRHAMLVPGGRVLAAVSGGVDSMVMLHVLHELGYVVEVAHFDHQTRTGASTEDAAFVEKCCVKMGIPCHTSTEPVKQDAIHAGRSFEEYARERRYAFLVDTAERLGNIPVATAHHEDDQAETVLMGILGLSSGFTLNGVAPVYSKENVLIIRPMLNCSRAAIEAYAREHDIAWREDATNAEDCCTRNRIRMELLPLLRKYNPQAGNAIARLADIMRTDGNYLDDLAEQAIDGMNVKEPPFMLDRSIFLGLPEALQRRMIKLLAQWYNTALTYERIVNGIGFIRSGTYGAKYELGGNVVLHITASTISIYSSEERAINNRCLPLEVPGDTLFLGSMLRTRILNRRELPEDIRSYCSATKQCFDAETLTTSLQVRSRKAGDRMIPLGMTHACKIQDIMVDLHIPAFQRDSVPLVIAGETILWIAGYRRSSLAPVDASTTRVIEMELLPQR